MSDGFEEMVKNNPEWQKAVNHAKNLNRQLVVRNNQEGIQPALRSDNAIVKIFESSIEGKEVNSVNLRDVHAYLEVATRFNDWSVDRLDGYTEGVDYITILKKEYGKDSKGLPLYTQYKEYIVNLDTAKHVCMMEKNAQGKNLRQYFIDCEKKLKDLKLVVVDNGKRSHLRETYFLKSFDFLAQLDPFFQKLQKYYPDTCYHPRTVKTLLNRAAYKTEGMEKLDIEHFADWLRAHTNNMLLHLNTELLLKVEYHAQNCKEEYEADLVYRLEHRNEHEIDKMRFKEVVEDINKGNLNRELPLLIKTAINNNDTQFIEFFNHTIKQLGG